MYKKNGIEYDVVVDKDGVMLYSWDINNKSQTFKSFHLPKDIADCMLDMPLVTNKKMEE